MVSVVNGLGYFVSLGALDALLHCNQTPVGNGPNAKAQFVSVGESVTARISSIDRTNGRVSLTMRAASSGSRSFEDRVAPAKSSQQNSCKTIETRNKPTVIRKLLQPAPVSAKQAKTHSKSCRSKACGSKSHPITFKVLLTSRPILRCAPPASMEYPIA